MTDIDLAFAPPAGLDWQGIAIDRSQAVGTSINLATISRGGGGVAPVTSRWSALQGAGTEAAALLDGMLCNQWNGIAWRALQYSLPIRINPSGGGGFACGAVGALSDTFVLDVLMAANTATINTGVFLMQWAGTVGAIVLPNGGSPVGIGFGFTANATAIQAWTSKGGQGAISLPLPTNNRLFRCVLTIVSARMGGASTYSMTVNGAPLQGGTLQSAVGTDYTIAGAAFVPIASADTLNVLSVADFTVLNSAPGLF